MGGYRYFFNGQEADNEVLGEGALHAFEYRMHDTMSTACTTRGLGDFGV